MKNNKKQLINIFQTYLNEIDDYYEAKEAFIQDLNKYVFEDSGVICLAKIKDELQSFEKIIDN